MMNSAIIYCIYLGKLKEARNTIAAAEFKMELLIKTACVDTILELFGTARIAAPP